MLADEGDRSEGEHAAENDEGRRRRIVIEVRPHDVGNQPPREDRERDAGQSDAWRKDPAKQRKGSDGGQGGKQVGESASARGNGRDRGAAKHDGGDARSDREPVARPRSSLRLEVADGRDDVDPGDAHAGDDDGHEGDQEARPDVDPARIGAVGMSMGGEQVVGAAATDTRIRAVVGEGVTGRAFADKAWLPRHWRGWVQRGIDGVLFTTADLLTDASPPVSLRDAVGQAAPRPVLLVAGGGVMGNAEEDADRWIQAGSPDTVEIWVVPDATHTAAVRTHPRQWEARVIGFLDSALLQ